MGPRLENDRINDIPAADVLVRFKSYHLFEPGNLASAREPVAGAERVVFDFHNDRGEIEARSFWYPWAFQGEVR